MARLPRLEVPGALYHVIARGNQRRTIFRDAVDYRQYISLLGRYQRRHGFTLYAYALMPNHVHLLLSPNRVPLGKSMQGLQQTYTRHFNRRHSLVGHCFQGRYKAILCQSDAYLLELIRYLHLNPVRAGLADTPDAYEWTSHRSYVGGKDGDALAAEAVLQHFSMVRGRAVAAYQAFVQAGLSLGHRDDLYTVVHQRLLGNERFVEKMERVVRQRQHIDPVNVSVDTIARQVAGLFGLSETQLRATGRSRQAARARAVIAYLAREEAAIPLKTIASYFRRDEATLSLAVHRLETQMPTDPSLCAQLDARRRAIRRAAPPVRKKQIIKA